MAGRARPRRAVDGGWTAVGAGIDVLAFVCELAMLAVLALSGWDLGSGGLLSVSLAVFYPALALLLWAVWLAPRASRRLPDPWRLVAQLALFGGSGAFVATAGHVVLGVLFAVVACAVFLATRITGTVTGGTALLPAELLGESAHDVEPLG
jgi:hypothetical protein